MKLLLALVLAALPAITTASSPANGLSAAFFPNAVLFEPACTAPLSVAQLASIDAGAVCGGKLPPALWSSRLYGQLNLPPGHYQLQLETALAVRLYVRGWKLVDSWVAPTTGAPRSLVAKYNFSVVANITYPVRLDVLSAASAADAAVGVSFSHRCGSTAQNPSCAGQGGAWAKFGTSDLLNAASAPEVQRQKLQSELSQGWNTWHRASATAHVHLPTLFGFDVTLADASAAGGRLLTGPRMNVRDGPAHACSGCTDRCDAGQVCHVRANTHTYNGSFTHFDQYVRPGLSVSFKSAHADGSGDSSVLLLTANGTADISSLSLQVEPAHFFDCGPAGGGGAHSASGYAGGIPCGNVTVGGVSQRDDDVAAVGTTTGIKTSIELRVPGLHSGASDKPQNLTVKFDAKTRTACVIAQPVGSAVAMSLADCIRIVQAAERRTEAAIESEYPRAKVGENRDVVQAIRAVIGWNVMWHTGRFVLTPVSRTFGKQPFEMWLWDTYFSTLLSAEASKELAYANLIEITRPTASGNVPGFRTQDDSVQDRSKPFVGGLVLLKLYEKFKDKWIVELLFPDLLFWTNWIRDRRTEQPANLIVLGSDNVAKGQSDGAQCTQTAVRWESGLDNSPMYDTSEVTFDYNKRNGSVSVGSECNYHFYDAGMTGLYLSMLDSLATLAAEIGRDTDAAELRSRHAATTKSMQATLWSEELGVFVNKQSRAPFRASSRVSPFNFHAMLSGAATAGQARTMAKTWLLADEGFCLTGSHSADHDSEGAAQAQAAKCNAPRQCATLSMDAKQPAACLCGTGKQPACPGSGKAGGKAACCSACHANAECQAFVWAQKELKCYLMHNVTALQHAAGREFGCVRGAVPVLPPPPKKPTACNFGMPSISHNDSAWSDNDYWRGRTWGPMNYLVYSGLKRKEYAAVAEVQLARKRLAESSRRLLLKEWLEDHHVHENYNSARGVGCDVGNSNPFYHWGGLLGLTALEEAGLY